MIQDFVRFYFCRLHIENDLDLQSNDHMEMEICYL